MVVVAGKAVDALACPQHPVPLDQAAAHRRLVGGVVVEHFQSGHAGGVHEFLIQHTAPDRVVVGDHAAVGPQHVAQLLGGLRALPLAKELDGGQVLQMAEGALGGILLHLAGAQDAVHVVQLIALVGANGPVKYRGGLQSGQDDEVLGVELGPVVGVDVVLGHAQEMVAVLLVLGHVLLGGQHAVGNGGVAVQVALIEGPAAGKAVVLTHGFGHSLSFVWAARVRGSCLLVPE